MVRLRPALAGVLCALVSSASAVSAAGWDPTVRTSAGAVQGRQADGVAAFLGIPYGADTGGANRFRAPKPAPAWTGVKAADRMGPRCPQPSLPKTLLEFSNAPISEDCLVLNVWTPAVKGKRPVMVWLHGGGFSFGSANDKYYDGASLARRGDVVVVSINHRLNVFGYLELGGADQGSGLVGQEDIILALKWVKANAARFGGDPANVTVFGQSGGGGKISALLGMPDARGLFHKAIIQSGADPKMAEPAAALAVRDRVLAALNLKPQDAGKLRDVPMADLVAASMKAGLLAYRPALDPQRLPAHPFDPAATPLSANVPIMLGVTRDEATAILYPNPGWAKMTGAERAGAILAAYRARAPQDKPMHIWANLMTDQTFTANVTAMAERKADQGRAPIFMYRVDWRSPVMDGALRAPHAVDVPFVFDTVGQAPELVGAGPSQAAMTELFIKTFSAFARTGNPSARGYPAWPAYTRAERQTFIYDDPPRVVADPDAALRRLWTGGR